MEVMKVLKHIGWVILMTGYLVLLMYFFSETSRFFKTRPAGNHWYGDQTK